MDLNTVRLLMSSALAKTAFTTQLSLSNPGNKKRNFCDKICTINEGNVSTNKENVYMAVHTVTLYIVKLP